MLELGRLVRQAGGRDVHCRKRAVATHAVSIHRR